MSSLTVFRSRNRTRWRVLYAPVLLCLTIGFGMTMAKIAAGVVLLALGAIGGAVLASFLRRRVIASQGSVIRERERIVVRDGDREVHSLPSDAVAGAWRIDQRAYVSERSGAVLDFATTSEAAAESALDKLGLGAAQRALEITIKSVASQIGGGELMSIIALLCLVPLFLGGGAAGLGMIGLVGGSIASLMLIALVVRAMSRRRVIIGTDGLRIQDALGARYISFARIAGVLPHEFGVIVVLDDRRRILLPTRRRDTSFPTAEQGDEMAAKAALLGRLEAVLASRKRKRAAFDLGLLDRSGRDADAWRAALLELCKAKYRQVAITGEALAEIVADPSQPPERRVGAALILREGSDKIVAAAEACADPSAAQALRAAAEGRIDSGALERAMEQHNQAAAPVRARIGVDHSEDVDELAYEEQQAATKVRPRARRDGVRR